VDTVVAALAAQDTELWELLADLDERGWQRPSRCAGWNVADVVLHLAQTNELATASATGRFAEVLDALADGLGSADDVDQGADLLVARERGAPVAELSARWHGSAEAQRRALAACDPRQRLMWVAGEVSARTLATTRLAETWIHTGDIAHALDRALVPTDRLWHVARLAWRTLPYAFARAGRELSGAVAFELRAPDGDSWILAPDDPPATVIRGDAAELCLIAARRADPAQTGLHGEGPDAAAVLELVRTYA